MMNENEKLWEAIHILMERSFWGTNASVDSLIRDLWNEVQEFSQACENGDAENVQEEAADVLMMLLCVLHRIVGPDTYFPDDISRRIVAKLHWRYQHLYTDGRTKGEESELNQWEVAKKVERRKDLMFCEDRKCSMYGKVGQSIQYSNGMYRCSTCGKKIIPSKNNTLLYHSKSAARYVREICDSMVAYAKGDANAVQSLCIDYPAAFQAFCSQLLDIRSKHDFSSIFMDYVQQKYRLSQKDLNEYFDHVREVREQMKSESLSEKYYGQIQRGDYRAKDAFTVHEWEKTVKELHGLTFDVAKKIENAIHFNSQNWDNQVVHKYLLHYPDYSSSLLIECMTLIHFRGDVVRDVTVELSNMYNCVVGCRFCASGALPGTVQYLNALDYVKQLNTCLSQSGINPADFEHFYVSFAGIGEPSATYEAVAAGMVIMRDMYPNIQFNIATFGYQRACFQYWNTLELPIRTLQVPLYHSEPEILRTIVVGTPPDYSFTDVVAQAVAYKKENPMCRVKLNYIPMKGINDSDEDVQLFLQVLEPFKNDIAVKVSFLNYTRPAEENGFTTPGGKRLEDIRTMFTEKNFHAYVFGSERNSALGCGQLAQDCISGQA